MSFEHLKCDYDVGGRMTLDKKYKKNYPLIKLLNQIFFNYFVPTKIIYSYLIIFNYNRWLNDNETQSSEN